MLEFREINYKSDVPELVKLIQKNLDASYSEEFFRWKHEENPFGKSYGLLGIWEGRIVALRMFMFWEFYHGVSKSIIKAVRPVDTVVDFSLRGQGVFKKITLLGLENCSDQFELIFNTPNENSLPGYLKMGWKQSNLVGNFNLGIINPFKSKLDFDLIESSELPSFMSRHDYWSTKKSSEYLSWRYKNSKYQIIANRDNHIVYSISKIKFFRQIIICELFGKEEVLQKMIRKLTFSLRTPAVYFYSEKSLSNINFLIKIHRKKAVIVFKNDQNEIQQNVDFSLGDLEGMI
jgi:hypothetical protein